MGKLGSHSSVRRASAVFLGLLLAGTAAPIAARASVFTWDPAGVLPSLGQPAFTADAIQGYHYLFDLSPIANPSPTIYTVHFIEPITGFTLAGATVATPGLNGTPGAAGSYGLYVQMNLQTQGIGPPNTYRYLGGSMSLMADPGNNNGALSSTIAGLSFANTGPTGTVDDITLATGSLVSGHFSINPAPGIRSIGQFVETLQPGAGEAGFFITRPDLIEETLTTPAIGGDQCSHPTRMIPPFSTE